MSLKIIFVVISALVAIGIIVTVFSWLQNRKKYNRRKETRVSLNNYADYGAETEKETAKRLNFPNEC